MWYPSLFHFTSIVYRNQIYNGSDPYFLRQHLQSPQILSYYVLAYDTHNNLSPRNVTLKIITTGIFQFNFEHLFTDIRRRIFPAHSATDKPCPKI